MNLETLAQDYITVPEIALDLSIPHYVASNLTRKHTFPKADFAFEKPVFKRDEYAQFKTDHADVIQKLREKYAEKTAA